MAVLNTARINRAYRTRVMEQGGEMQIGECGRVGMTKEVVDVPSLASQPSHSVQRSGNNNDLMTCSLINDANSCWLNSCLQLLNMTLPQAYVSDYEQNSHSQAVRDVMHIIRRMRQSREALNAHELLWPTLRVMGYRLNEQEDAHEFISRTIGAEFNPKIGIQGTYNIQLVNHDDDCTCDCAWEGNPSVHETVLILRDGSTTVQGGFNASLTEDVTMLCDRCSRTSGYRKHTQILEAGFILLLTIPRWATQDNKADNCVQIDRNVMVNNRSYKLLGGVVHIGKNRDRGHYVAFKFNWNKDSVKILDDVRCTTKDADTYLQSGEVMSGAYILTYVDELHWSKQNPWPTLENHIDVQKQAEDSCVSKKDKVLQNRSKVEQKVGLGREKVKTKRKRSNLVTVAPNHKAPADKKRQRKENTRYDDKDWLL